MRKNKYLQNRWCDSGMIKQQTVEGAIHPIIDIVHVGWLIVPGHHLVREMF